MGPHPQGQQNYVPPQPSLDTIKNTLILSRKLISDDGLRNRSTQFGLQLLKCYYDAA